MNMLQYRHWCSGYAKDRSRYNSTFQYFQPETCFDEQGVDEERDEMTSADNMQMQMSHTLRTSKAYYGCKTTEPARGSVLDGRNMPSFEAVSIEWHKDLDIHSGSVGMELFPHRQGHNIGRNVRKRIAIDTAAVNNDDGKMPEEFLHRNSTTVKTKTNSSQSSRQLKKQKRQEDCLYTLSRQSIASLRCRQMRFLQNDAHCNLDDKTKRQKKN